MGTVEAPEAPAAGATRASRLAPRLTRPDSYDQGMRAIVLGCLLGASVTGCSAASDEADRATGEISGSAGAVAVERFVAEELGRHGLMLETGPVCTPHLDRDGASLSGTVECVGTATDGRDVNASFEGSLSTAGCDGTFVVLVGTERVVDVTAPEGCSVAT